MSDSSPGGTTEIIDHAFVYELPHSLRLEHQKSRTLPHSGFTRTALTISWRHRKTKSDEGARHWRSRGSRSRSALITGNIIHCQSNAASERKFIQMDSRNISENAFLCLAGRLRCLQRRHFWRGCNRGLYRQSNGASPGAIFSRGVYSDASEARFCARNRCSFDAFCRPCRDSLHCKSVYPALKRWAIFKGALVPAIYEIVFTGP